MSTQPDEQRRAEIERLSKLPQFPERPPDREKGVLLSDRIKHYCERYKLISPFDIDHLRPAAYALTVGRRCSISGAQRALDEGVPLEIGPYQVAIIETYETINLPPYLIGRWNVQTKKAYKGLLWVGGAQVDPGFRGYLCCPIYNLSTENVTLNFRDTLAVIDFVTTTPYEVGKCMSFPWAERKMLSFSEYPQLSSGIEARVRDFDKRIETNEGKTDKDLASIREKTAADRVKDKDRSDESFRGLQARIDTFLTLIFTVVAVLFAALGIVATKGSEEPSFLNPPVWIAAVALFFGLRAYVEVKRGHQPGPWYASLVTLLFAIAITAVLVLGSSFIHGYRNPSSAEIQQVREQTAKATSALDRERKDREEQTRGYDSKFQALQQQVNLLLRNQAAKK